MCGRIAFPASIPLALLIGACQPDPPAISDKPVDPPAPVDTDEGVPLRQPDIEVEPAELTFGGRPADCTSPPETLTIRNVGNNPLRIDDITIGGQDGGVYEIVGTPPDLIRAGDEATVQVVFTPSSLNVTYERARVIVTSNDPDEAEVRVPMRGEGSEAVTLEDVFLQQNATAVDILFVLDNSGSMGDTIGRIRGAMSTFVNSFVNLGLDYRLAITTTHLSAGEDSSGVPIAIAGSEGWFVGPWMDESRNGSAQGVVTAFQGQVDEVLDDVGVSSAGDTEQGLGASQAALSAPNINQQPNSGFIRSDATLAVAMISDEDDYTSGLNATGYATWLAGIKGGDMDQVSFSGLIGPQTGGLTACGTLINGAGAAPRYHNVINQTGGVWGNICQVDIQPFLQFLSYVAAGLEIRFELDGTPVAATGQAIQVRVCDAQGTCTAVPQSAVDGWTFDVSTNSIEMNGDWIPEPGESVVVTYAVPSDCPT